MRQKEPFDVFSFMLNVTIDFILVVTLLPFVGPLSVLALGSYLLADLYKKALVIQGLNTRLRSLQEARGRLQLPEATSRAPRIDKATRRLRSLVLKNVDSRYHK